MKILRYTAERLGLIALFKVCQTDNETPMMTKADIPATLSMFINTLGHLEHLLSPDHDHFGIHP